MELNLIAEKEITDFEKQINHTLNVNERPIHSGLSRYYVSFKGCESIEGGHFVGYSGNGNTIDEALQDYCKQVSCRRMVFGAYTNGRREITFPKLIHTKLLNK